MKFVIYHIADVVLICTEETEGILKGYLRDNYDSNEIESAIRTTTKDFVCVYPKLNVEWED